MARKNTPTGVLVQTIFTQMNEHGLIALWIEGKETNCGQQNCYHIYVERTDDQVITYCWGLSWPTQAGIVISS